MLISATRHIRWNLAHKLLILGLGNYDVNVVTAALLDRQCDIIWFDRRKDPNTIRLGRQTDYILK